MLASGHIVSPKGRALPWSEADAVWLRRAVQREGEPRGWVAQALVNRWAMLRDLPAGRSYPTLGSFVRAYAQPVNPRWFPDGDKHLAAMSRAKSEAERAALLKRATARRDEHSRRNTFSATTERAVEQALQGPITLPAGVTDYAMDSEWARRHHGEPFTSEPGQNAFWRPHPGVLYSIGPNHPTHPAGRALRSAGPHAGWGVVLLLGLIATPFVVSARPSSRLRRRRA